MTDHHDAELCKRLAKNVMGWHEFTWRGGPTVWMDGTEEEAAPIDWDPCCNPAHSWLLEQKMADLGWEYRAFQGAASFHKGMDIIPLFEAANRLASTAVAADEVTK